MSQSNLKMIALRLPPDLYAEIELEAKEENRSVANYVKNLISKSLRSKKADMDTTEYLLSNPANKKIMYDMLEEVKKKDYITFENADEAIKYVQNLAK